MAFIRTRTIKGRQYVYREERWREDGKVRSKSTLLRKLGGFIDSNFKYEAGAVEADRASEQGARVQAEREAQAVAAREAHLNALHSAYGLKVGPTNPTPVDAPKAHTGASEAKDAPDTDAPSDGEGVGQV